MGKIAQLLKVRYDLDREYAEKWARSLEWCAFNNPYADGEPTYFIAEDDGNIVAHLARMPSKFIINGKLRKGYFIHHLYVHPEYTKKGMGLFLSMSLYNALENSTESFCCSAWTAPINLEMLRRRGHYELWADRYVKLLNPYEILSKFLRQESLLMLSNLILRYFLFIADSILLKVIPSNIQISKVDRFDSRFDDLSQRLLSKIGVCTFKSSSYLNWKYIDRPFSRMEVFAAEENGQIIGFLVVAPNVRKDYPGGTIVDIMADPDDKKTILSLLKVAISYFKEKKVHSIECCLTDKRFLRLLKKFFFAKAFVGEPVLLWNLHKCKEKDFLIDINKWHLTSGESDLFLLIPQTYSWDGTIKGSLETVEGEYARFRNPPIWGGKVAQKIISILIK